MSTHLIPRDARERRSDYAELSSRIRSGGLLERRTTYYLAKFTLTWASFGAAWVAFVLIGATWWQLVTAVVLGVLSTQIAFLGHDLGHKQVTRTRRTSYLLGMVHCNLVVGLSMGWWLDKHNRHHAHPNHTELDPDVAPGRAADPLPRARGRPPGTVRLSDPPPGAAVLPAHTAGRHQPARRQHRGAAHRYRQGPTAGGGPARRPPDRVRRRPLPRAEPVAGAGLHRGPPGGVGPVHELLVRPQPQGHATAHPRRAAGLPAPQVLTSRNVR
ncbi:MAG: fatty acid desaturase [Frankiales bacterium]|nr:fatty acid desaturase [Frankiales bacterium]